MVGNFRLRGVRAGDPVDVLRRGDLREVLGWESPHVGDQGDGDGGEGHDGRDARPQVEPEPRARAAPQPRLQLASPTGTLPQV